MQPAPFSERTEQFGLHRLARESMLDDRPDLPLSRAAAAFPASAVAKDPKVGSAELILNLDDIVSDGNGDAVLLDDAGLTRLAITTDASIVTGGVARGHTVATGEDVSGFAYVTFATGLTLYYPGSMELAVLPHG